MHYSFRGLQREDIPAMHQAFLKAFADYQLPFQLSFDQFVQKFIYKLNIDYDLSVGTFFKGHLVGFIFSSTGIYRGKQTAYNGGTGVVNEHRGNNLTIRMYDYLIPKLKERNIRQAVLEVLTENERAVKSYERCGFSIYTTYHCYKLKKFSNPANNLLSQISISRTTKPDWSLYEKFADTTPYFLDSTPILRQNLEHEHLAEARLGDEIVGYIIFQPQVSRLSHIAVDKNRRGNGIGKMLLDYALKASHTNSLTVLNVDQSQKTLINILKHIGFEPTVDQFEMVREI